MPSTRRRKGRIHVSPRRVRTRWYPGDEEQALYLAEQGNLTRACQLIDAMRSDGVIRSLLEIRSNGLIKLPVNFDGDPELCRELEGDPAQNDDGLFWHLAPSNEQARIIRWGIQLGMGIGEIVDEDGSGDGVLHCLDPHHVRVVTSGPDQGRMFYQTDEREEEIIFGDGRWFGFFPYGQKRFWIEGTWYAAAGAWLSKRDSRLQRNTWGRRLAAGIMHWKAPHASSDRQRNRMRDLFASLTDPPIAVTKKDSNDKGWELDYKEAQGQGYRVWTEDRTEANEELAIIFTGSPINVWGTPGFAAGDIQATVSHTFVEGNGKTWGEAVTDHLLAPLAERRGALAVRASWQTARATDKKTEGEALTAFGNGWKVANDAAAPYNKRVNISDFAAKFGINLEQLPDHKDTSAAQIYAYHIESGAVTLNDVRENLGMARDPALGNMTAAEFKAKIDAEHNPPPDAVANPAVIPAFADEPENPEDEPTPDHRAALADMMTKCRLETCEHLKKNRCWICGIERDRGVTLDPTGKAVWKLAWRPITESAVRTMREMSRWYARYLARAMTITSTDYRGVPVRIEYPAGSVRVGPGWSTVMSAHYGEIPGTLGNDGDPLDVYLAKNPMGDVVHVLAQLDADGALDEYKLFLGFATPEDVIDCYLAHVPRPELIGEMFAVPLDILRGLCGDGPVTRAITAFVHELAR